MADTCGAAVERCALALAGDVLVYGTVDGRVEMWRWRDDAPPRVLARTSGAVRALAVSPDGTRVAAGSADGSVVVHRVDDGTALVKVRHGPVWSCAFGPNGRRLVTASEDRVVRVLDCDGGNVLSEYPADGAVHAVAWSGDGRQIAAYDAAGDLHLLEPRGAAAHSH
jgi:eukaryotic-like serine/threonine-protein kinase